MNNTAETEDIWTCPIPTPAASTASPWYCPSTLKIDHLVIFYTRGPWWPCNAHMSNTALWEPDLELIKANILIKVQNDYINKYDNVACLMGCEIKVKVKYGWLHSRGHAKMYACTKYHWLREQWLLRNWPKHKHFTSTKYHSVGPIITEKLT